MTTWAERQGFILRCRELPPQSKLVYFALLKRRGKNKQAWPSQDTLATDAGLSKDAVKRYLRPLYASGLVVSKQRFRQSALYTLPEHPLFAGKALMALDPKEVRALARRKREGSQKQLDELHGKVPKPKPTAPPKLAVVVNITDAPSKPAPTPAPPTELERAEGAWRSAMAKTYPKVPVAATRWTAKTKPGLHAASLVADYGVESVEKYFSWIVTNWGSLVKRFEKSKGFPSYPQIIWALWKAEELVGEAMGGVEATPAQQATDVYAEAAAWRKANPGKILLPSELSARLANAPKIAGQKL